MSFSSYDKFGRSEFFYSVSERYKLQHKNTTEIKSNLTTKKQQRKLLQSEMSYIKENFNNFQKEINLEEIKDMR